RPVSLFKRRAPAPSSSTEEPEPWDLADLARSRGWAPIEGAPFDGGVTSNLWRLNFALYGLPGPHGVGVAHSPGPRPSSDHQSYRGTVEDRRIVVTNHQTNIALLESYDFKSVAVCAIELGTIAPIVLVEPRGVPSIARQLTRVPTGDPQFD